ncbi:hypothetical protein HBI56_095040 [Parastagonospora nodorum]|nr:hypothetical protein HBH53_142070 [Parastagonospora nodorum]KAH3966187.1 hypothetical protein HBH51_143290 [Parastagonospora nodorum]KAH3989335.1 hypothetical protein HBH52_018290 [Parastagonospora nodorum]KAH3998358.1 hypothetical protein HBI10_131180 [Parastagonospora nodorum]KAH4030066.1 hypothetical protein HBI13_036420 [Parastagonospora nodorum]
MAKKKNKKNNQKQAEVAAPPENLKAVNNTATEESPANEETQQLSPAPPLEPPSDDTPVVDSTSVPDQNLESTQDTPSEDKSSMLADATTDGEKIESAEPDHVHTDTPVQDAETVMGTVESQPELPAEENEPEADSSDPIPAADADVDSADPVPAVDAEELPLESSDDQQVLSEPIEPTEEVPQPVSDVVLDEESQVQLAEDQEAPTSSTELDNAETENQAPELDETAVDAPDIVNAVDNAEPEGVVTSTESAEVEAEEPSEHDPSLEFINQEVHEDDALQAEAPETPAAESSEPQVEHAEEAEPVAEGLAQPTEALADVEAPIQSDVPSSMAEEPPVAEMDDVHQDEVAPMEAPEPPPTEDETHTTHDSELLISRDVESVKATDAALVEAESPLPAKETAKQRRRRLAEEELEREEQEKLDQESFEQYRIDQERLEMARLEQKRLEREKMRQERLEKERIEQERIEEENRQQEKLEKERIEAEQLEQDRLEAERLEKERIESEKLEAENLERIRAEQERLVNERIEQDRLEQERLDEQRRKDQELEKQKLEQEAAAAAAAAAEEARNMILQAQAEASQKVLEQESLNSVSAENAAREVGEEPTTQSPAPSATQVKEVLKAVPEPAQLSTPPPDGFPQPPVPASGMRTSNPGSRLPTPAASVGRTSSPRSVATDASKSRAHASEHPPSQIHPAQRSEDLDHGVPRRHASNSPALPAPRPQAVSQIIEDNRPPAPSPPVGRLRARHAPAFEDTEDDSDSAMVRSSRRQFRGVGGGEDYDRPSGSYPQPPTHHRFASRVPAEQSYPNPPPPQHPPGYHPYYPPAAPPQYQNHNYRVSQSGYPPPPNTYGPSPHSSSSPYTEPWNYPPGYRHDSPSQRHDTLVTRDYPLGIDTRGGFGDDPGDVFSRIAQAIPDLHVLLARYKETHGQLSVREELLRRSSIEQEQRLKVKDDEIEGLKEQIRNLEHKYSTETSRLRANLDEQTRDLQDQRFETERFKKEAQETKIALEAAMKSWEAKYKELAEAHAVLSRAAAEEKANFEEWKSSLTTRTDAEKIALAIQFDKRLKEADVLAEDQRQEAAAAFANERDELIADHERRQAELQESFDQLRTELEAKLSIAHQAHEDAVRHERESRDMWHAEREALMMSHRDDRESIRRSWDEQRDALEAQYKKSKDESDQAWIELHADASKRAEEENAKVNQLIKEKEELQKRYNSLKAESEQEKAIIKSVANNLESEKSRLEKLMECYGDIAEIKSKGDTYYLVSFSQLQKQIIDLATTHFVHLPVRPPPEDLAQVPSNLPSFLGDTIASRQVRSAYIAHTVSKLITYRVFGPFLFSLGRRYDKADSLFLSMSHHIRDKSTRKEAIWRQQTLLAAFTSSGAKQRINTAAGTVVEEIVSAIKHFADPREEEGIKIAVKRIVKLAAETWRFARLEREMINATMPAISDEEHQFTGPEFWPSYDPYKPEGTLIGSLVDHPASADEKPQLLLRLFPVIWREQKHENFHANGEKPDEGCIFHHGLALYEDAEPVAQRMEELKSAGLPSYTTTASPTIAENGKFPPPIVPPPRETPPNPPAMAEKSDRSTTRTAPPSPTEYLEKSEERQKTPPPPPSSIPSFDEAPPSTFVKAYQRPPPGPIDFASPRDLIGLPPPVESVFTSHSATPKKTSVAPRAPTSVESTSTRSVPRESSMASPPPPSVPPPPPPVPDRMREPRQTTSVESAILPDSFPEPSPSDKPPTPPHSRSGTPEERPISPLFEAVDEIESLHSHQSRPSSKSLSRRRSTHSRRSKESKDLKDEMPNVEPATDRHETSRRTSGYALSTKSAKTVDSERTDRTSRSEKTNKTDKSERDAKSRYMCESRSAAIKALYPDSPLAGQSGSGSTKGSVSSSKKKDRDSKELKHKKSIADHTTFISENTWDTTSEVTHNETASPKKKDRNSKELRRKKSIADNTTFVSVGTWDTNTEITSKEVPSPKKREPNTKELRRKRSIADNTTFVSVGTWDTNSEVTSLAAERNTHISTS